MQNSIKINKLDTLTPEILDNILKVERDSFKDPWNKAMFRVGENEKIAVLLNEEEVCGFLCYIVFLDECHILNVAVNKSMRNKGLGQKMMDWLFNTETQAALFYLEVRDSNHPAISLYEKNQFKVVGIRKAYYKDGEDAVVMCRDKEQLNGEFHTEVSE